MGLAKDRAKIATALVLFGATLAACTLVQIPQREPVCTLIGCGASLEIALVGEHVPTVFSAAVTADSGEYVNIRCTDGNAVFEPPEAGRWAPTCPAGGVTLQDFAPAQVSVSLRWSEGETSQEFAPTYAEARPNGPDCEPTCRWARIEVQIPKIPAYGDESAWELYVDEAYGFNIRYPRPLGLELGPRSEGHGIAYIGEKIQIRTTWRDPLVCQGECPLIESTEPVTIAGRPAKLAQGYIGSVGGNIPQYFMLYLFRLGDAFVSFELYAESRNAQIGDPSVIIPLKQEDIELFERMMSTLEFTQ